MSRSRASDSDSRCAGSTQTDLVPGRDGENEIRATPSADEYSYEAMKEDERFHPSIGESWAPASRDDHVRGLRHSVPEDTETAPLATAEQPAEPSFFGVISDAFGAATSHSRRPVDAPPPRDLLETEPDPDAEFREDPRFRGH
jgi:hypothetical protein